MPNSKASLLKPLAILAWIPWLFFGLFAVGATWDTVAMLTDHFERGVVWESEATRGFAIFKLEDGTEGSFPHWFLAQARPSQVALLPGDVVEKRRGSLVYWLNGQPLGGRSWQVGRWIWPILLPLAAAAAGMISFRVLFRRFPSSRDLTATAS